MHSTTYYCWCDGGKCILSHLGDEPPGSAFSHFPLGPSITSHALQAFYTFAPKTSVESRTNFTDTTLSRWLSGYETILSQWRGLECWLRRKTFFQSESRDQGNVGRNVKLCSIFDTHRLSWRWNRNFRLNILLGHTFGHSWSIGFAHRTTEDATRPNSLHRSASWFLILMRKILDFWSFYKTWMERGRMKILW